MSFTHSFNRLENVSQDDVLRATLPSDKSKQMTQSKNRTQLAEFNWRERRCFNVYLLSFLHKFTDGLLWEARSVFISPTTLFGIAHCPSPSDFLQKNRYCALLQSQTSLRGNIEDFKERFNFISRNLQRLPIKWNGCGWKTFLRIHFPRKWCWKIKIS